MTMNNKLTVEIECIKDERGWHLRHKKLNYCQFPSFPQHSGHDKKRVNTNTIRQKKKNEKQNIPIHLTKANR